MKRKITMLSVVFFILCTCVYAESWDDFSDVDKAWDGQKSITNKEFEEVMDALQQKQKKKDEKKRAKAIKKISGGGTSLHDGDTSKKEITEMNMLKDKTEGHLINVPVSLMLNEKILEKGYYKVLGEKDKTSGKVYICFYQSQFLKGKVEATETNDDYGEETLDFAKLIPAKNSFMTLLYGSLEFNAYAYIPYAE